MPTTRRPARSLAGGSTADGMIGRTGVRESALGEPRQAWLVDLYHEQRGTMGVSRFSY
jgi:hypothetical protein